MIAALGYAQIWGQGSVYLGFRVYPSPKSPFGLILDSTVCLKGDGGACWVSPNTRNGHNSQGVNLRLTRRREMVIPPKTLTSRFGRRASS